MATELSPLTTPPDTASSAGNQSWLDVQGLNALHAQAAQASPEVLKKVAQQFESLFMGMMLKSMRDAKLGDSLPPEATVGLRYYNASDAPRSLFVDLVIDTTVPEAWLAPLYPPTPALDAPASSS